MAARSIKRGCKSGLNPPPRSASLIGPAAGLELANGEREGGAGWWAGRALGREATGRWRPLLRPPLEGAARPGMGPARPAAAGGERRLRPGLLTAAREGKGLRARHGPVRVDQRVAGGGGDAGGPAARRAPLRRGGEGEI